MKEVLSWGRCLTERVNDEATGRTLIRKRVKKKDAVMARQFRKEVEILLWLDGRGAPSLYECRETEEELILEEQEITARLFSSLSQKKKKELLPQLVQVLEKIHEAGYVYLDLKPEHILSDGRQVWLIDFNGVMELESRSCLFGSRSILPPEIRERQPVTVKADSYAFGTLLVREKLYPVFARKCLRSDPHKRPLLTELKPVYPALCLVPLLIILSVFAAGQWSGVTTPASGLQDSVLIRQSLDACADPVCQLDLLEGAGQMPDQDRLGQIRSQITTEKEACRYLEYALRLSLQGIRIPVPDAWDDQFTGTYAQLKEIWRKQNHADYE